MSTRPRWWAARAVVLATSLLPPGPVRRRYRDELSAELWAMSPLEQARWSSAVLLRAPRLHRALVEAGVLTEPHSPLWCRARLHHVWHTVSTDDGALFRRCRECGTDDDGTYRPRPSAGYGVAVHGISPN